MAQIAIAESEPAIVADDGRYEIIAGRRVEKPPLGAFESWIASLFQDHLGPFARARGLGRVTTETLFTLDKAAGLDRRPDVAYVSYDRWPRRRRVQRDAAWEVVPDLAIEIISPSNTASEVLNKIRDYFRTGVRRVWVVYPVEGQVYIYDTPTSVRILSLEAGDSLDGGDLLPGFTLPLATLFEEDAVD
jgi:Uma2 family endonuclease